MEAACWIVYDPIRKEVFSASIGKGSYLENASGKQRLHVKPNTELKTCYLDSMLSTSFLLYDPDLVKFRRVLPKFRAFRSCGSACLSFSWLAASRVDAIWHGGFHLWDVAAGWCISEEAGAIFTDFAGKPHSRKTIVTPTLESIVANPTIHALLVKEIAE